MGSCAVRCSTNSVQFIHP
uniref:Uncharacterized protein n=1 Tax=Arundo donax TaxID=35708 RepID=A0A0A9DQT4_ARUDO